MLRWLREYGELYPRICWTMLTWFAFDRDLHKNNESNVRDLMFSSTYAVQEKEAKDVTLLIAYTGRISNFLENLRNFSLDIIDLYPHYSNLNYIPVLHHIFQKHIPTHVMISFIKFMVLRCRADVDIKNRVSRQTPLMLACAETSQQDKVVTCLINELGAEVNVVDNKGLTALDYTMTVLRKPLQHPDIKFTIWMRIEKLLKKGAEFGPKLSCSMDKLLVLAENEDVPDVVKLLNKRKKPRYY